MLRDGRVLWSLGDVSRRAGAELDRQWARLSAKFATLAEPVLGNARAVIASWHTEGFNQRGERVIDFERTNMVHKREAGSK